MVIGLVLLGGHTSAEICKGIARLANNETLGNEYNMGTGWYGNGEISKGQFVPSPFAFASSDYDVRGGACIPTVKNVACHQSKGKANCNEAQTCTQLLDIKRKLLAGGYNCFGRHERTYWHQYYGESSCKAAANCASATAHAGTGQPTGIYSTPSRYLSPWGWKSSEVQAEAFKAMGLNNNTDTFASSPFPRCRDGLAHFATTGASELNAVVGEKLMYTGSLRENLQRKGFCTTANSDDDINIPAGYMYVFDEMRKLAGTPPASGKNNWYMTHGFNMKGAFGEQVDEGYWMCLRPNSVAFPNVQGRSFTEHQVCSEGAQPTVDFMGVFQFSTEFLLSSESLHLMNSCTVMEDASGGLFNLDTDAPKLELTQTEVGSTTAFEKLLEIQNHALSFVPIAAEVDRDVFHLGLFVHNNGGYRYPDTVHVPLRRIIEDTITDRSYTSRFAIAQAIIDAGDDASYTGSCTDSSSPIYEAIAKCYNTQYNTGSGWYWGGKSKTQVNVDSDFVSSTIYGSVEWKGSPTWFDDEYTSGYIEAGSCLVAHGSITLTRLLANMGCPIELSCAQAKRAYKDSACCGNPGGMFVTPSHGRI